MTLRNMTINGNGIRKWFWYAFFEIVTVSGLHDFYLEDCTVTGFSIHRWETRFFQLPQFIIEESVKRGYMCFNLRTKKWTIK